MVLATDTGTDGKGNTAVCENNGNTDGAGGAVTAQEVGTQCTACCVTSTHLATGGGTLGTTLLVD